MRSFAPLKTIKRASKSNLSQENLDSFSIDAAISAASNNKPLPSQHSFVTNASYATANESTTAVASYFVDSSDDEENNQQDRGLNFGNDPLAKLSQAKEDAEEDTHHVDEEFARFLRKYDKPSAATEIATTTPTEISFKNPEETTIPITMASKVTSTTRAAAPVVATRVAVPPPPAEAVETTKAAPQDQEGHFDVAQAIYGATKDVWAWGKTVAVISSVLGLTEAVAEKLLDTVVHKDLPAIDQEVVKPNLKKLDDDIVNPVILAVWKLIEPAVGKAEEMVVKPVIDQVLPRVLGPLGLFDNQQKKDLDAKKEEERAAMIDTSPTPEVVPALN